MPTVASAAKALLARCDLRRIQADRAELEHSIAFYRQFVRKGDLCFDVGAHVGARTAAFLRLGARVVAVEPQERCVRALRKRFGGDRRVALVTQGLADKPGEQTLYVSNVSTCTSMSAEWIDAVKDWERLKRLGCQWEGRQTVSVTTLDALIAKHGMPRFCKIDVEGFEYSVLRGLTRPIEQISFEYNPQIRQTALDCVEYVAGLGDYCFNYAEGDDLEMARPEWFSKTEMIRIINEVMPGRMAYGDIYARLAA